MAAGNSFTSHHKQQQQQLALSKQCRHAGDSAVSGDSNHNEMHISSRQQSSGGNNSRNSQPTRTKA